MIICRLVAVIVMMTAVSTAARMVHGFMYLLLQQTSGLPPRIRSRQTASPLYLLLIIVTIAVIVTAVAAVVIVVVAVITVATH